METIIESRTSASTLAEMMPRMARVPLSFQPGTAWEYWGAPRFEALGHVVEIVSGQPLDQFLRERLFELLGCAHDVQRAVGQGRRVATVYERTDGQNSQLQPACMVSLFPQVASDPNNRYFSGGGGLVGTAEDYARFAMMLAANGTLDGQRILGRNTVDLMASNHIGQLGFERSASDLSGCRFGLGVRVIDSPADAATLASRGTFGWGPSAPIVGSTVTANRRGHAHPAHD